MDLLRHTRGRTRPGPPGGAQFRDSAKQTRPIVSGRSSQSKSFVLGLPLDQLHHVLGIALAGGRAGWKRILNSLQVVFG